MADSPSLPCRSMSHKIHAHASGSVDKKRATELPRWSVLARRRRSAMARPTRLEKKTARREVQNAAGQFGKVRLMKSSPRPFFNRRINRLIQTPHKFWAKQNGPQREREEPLRAEGDCSQS